MPSGSSLPSPAEKPRYVSEMFGRVARRYDLMNSLMSLGMDASWRQTMAQSARIPEDGAILDVGTGTARLALALAEHFPTAGIVGVDFADPMLRTGQNTLAASAPGLRVRLARADALHLPFPAGHFDAVVSAFVMRNLADVAAGIREQVRVLRPGGRLLVLEITPGPSGLLRPFFRLYFRGLVPLVGKLVTGDSTAYTYLPESAAAFLQPESLVDVLRQAGLHQVSTRRLTFGAVALTIGTRPG